MASISTALLLLLATAASCARTFAPGPAPSGGVAPVTLSSTFRPVRAGQSCADVCQGSPLMFSSSALASSSLCAFTTTSGLLQVGSESSSRPGVCQTSASLESTAFSCQCLAPGQVQGLALPLPGDATCDASCAVGIDASVGMAVTLAAGNRRRVCIASSDIGTLNSFAVTTPGSASSPVSCSAGSSFSCVCTFSSASLPAAQAPSAPTEPRVAAFSLGATLG